jgi:hypothetical protein
MFKILARKKQISKNELLDEIDSPGRDRWFVLVSILVYKHCEVV